MPQAHAGPVRVAVALATTASAALRLEALEGTLVDIVVSGGIDLSEPSDADLHRTVRLHPDLPERLAAAAISADAADAFVSPAHVAVAAAALNFVLGTQRGATAPSCVALFDRADAAPLVAVSTTEPAALVLAVALAEVLGGSAHVGADFAAALLDGDVGVVTVPAGLVDGWVLAGGAPPIHVVLGVPVVAVVGSLDRAVQWANTLVAANLVGCTSQALASVVQARREAAGLTGFDSASN